MGITASKNGLILHHSWADEPDAVITSNAGQLMPIENVLNPQPSEIWRSVSGFNATIDVDFGQARGCNAFCLWNHNLDTDDDFVRFILADDAGYLTRTTDFDTKARYIMQGWGEQPWDVGPIGGDDSGLYPANWTAAVFTPDANRYCRITCWSPAAAKSFEAGRFMVGTAWQPGVNFEWGVEIGWVDPSELSQTRGNQLRANQRPKYRRGRITWRWLDDYDTRVWHTIVNRIGKGNTVLIIPDPSLLETTLGREHTVLARITHVTQPVHLRTRHYTASMDFTEAI